MGKQVCFYASQKDVEALIDQIQRSCAIVVDASGSVLGSEALLSIADFDYCKEHFGGNKFFVTKPDLSLLYYRHEGHIFIDQMQSEVIELSLCSPSPLKVVDTSSIDNNYLKNGFVVVSDSDAYSRQMSELMKNPVYVLNPNYVENGFDYGRIWYSPDYVDVNGSRAKKSDDLHKLYKSLSKFVKSNFKMTRDKSAYIGQDAYEKHLQGVYVPCSGRYKVIVD